MTTPIPTQQPPTSPSMPPKTQEPPQPNPTHQQPQQLSLLPLAEFKPPANSRAWVSVPNPNGLPLIATATSDKTVRVYSLRDFGLHSVLEGGHARSVRSVDWKPDVRDYRKLGGEGGGRGGKRQLCLATGSFDATMGIWRRFENGGVGEGEERVRVRVLEEEEEVISSDGLEVEVEGDGAVKRHGRPLNEEESEPADDWEFSIVLEGHDSEVKHVSYSPSGQYLASCSRDKSIWIWEDVGEEGEDEFETVAVLQDHTADVKFVCWRGDDGDGLGETLASASYDNTVRFWRGDGEGEWSCVGVLEGHEGTVWCLDWEPEVSVRSRQSEMVDGDEEKCTPRLASSSADCTLRIWSKLPAPPPPNRPSYFNSGIPSTMRPPPAEETWECTAILPKAHDLPIYSINWSKKSGLIVSTGGDGKVIVYAEITKGRTSVGGKVEREWVIIGMLEGGHGPYEINHVAWCTRFDKGKREVDEEILVTTGDDGIVRAWSLEGPRHIDPVVV